MTRDASWSLTIVAAVAMAILGLTTPSANAQITIDDSGTATVGGIQPSFTLSEFFDASGSDKLVVMVSMERDRGDPNTTIAGVTYNDTPMMQAIQFKDSINYEPPGIGPAAIFYLDNPGPGGAIVASGSAKMNGAHGAWLALFGTAEGVGPTSGTVDASTAITMETNNSFVVAHNHVNEGTVPVAEAPLTPLLSSDGRYSEAASGYQIVSGTGTTVTPTFSAGRTPVTVAAAFEIVDARCPWRSIASGGAGGVTLSWQNGNEIPASVRILRDTEEIESAVPADPPSYTDVNAQPGLIDYELIFTMPGEACEALATTFDGCITDLAGSESDEVDGVVLTWTNNLAYDTIEIRRDGEVIEASLDGNAETYTDEIPPHEGFASYTVVPTNGTCDSTTVEVNLGPVRNAGFEEPVLADGEVTEADGLYWTLGYYDVFVDPTLWQPGVDDAGVWNPDAAGGFSDSAAFAGQNTGWAISRIGFDKGLSQVLGVALEADTKYTLSVQVGNALYNGSDETAPFRVELLAGDVLLASAFDNAPVADTWESHSLTYDSADNPEQVGNALEIRLIAVEYVDGDGADGYEVDFDQVALTSSGAQGASFVRGDADADGDINITDGISLLNFLFLGGEAPGCKDALDADNSNAVDITDGIYVLNFLFLGGGIPSAPWPDCGPDPDGDATVTCETSHPGCSL